MTLPSNSSAVYYPDNTLTNFTTKLQNDVDLQGDWEIGLWEIIFPKSWYNVPKQDATIKIFIQDAYESRPLLSKLNYLNFLDIGQAKDPMVKEERGGTSTKSLEIQFRIPHRYYNSIEELVREVNDCIELAYQFTMSHVNQKESQVDLTHVPARSYSRLSVGAAQDNWPKLEYRGAARKVQCVLQENFEITFADRTSQMLGFEPIPLSATLGKSGKAKVRGQTMVDMEAGLQILYLYCDVLKCVPVGDTEAPLLRLIDAAGAHGSLQQRGYEKPLYVPVQKKNFDSIQILINDDQGRAVPFEEGRVIVTLHFRPSKLYFSS